MLANVKNICEQQNWSKQNAWLKKIPSNSSESNVVKILLGNYIFFNIFYSIDVTILYV